QALVVDDSKSARMMLQRLLSKINVNAEAVESAEEALRFLEKQQPDVIFMDHMMPGMDGLEATQLIKSNPRTASIPTIMYTSKEGKEYQDMALSHGANGVLAKPASHEAVMAVIQSLDKPAANDEPAGTHPPAIPLVEIDKLIQKNLTQALEDIRNELTASVDEHARGLKASQSTQLDLMQARMSQHTARLQEDINASLTEAALFKKTRNQNQRLAVAVADKLVKKNVDDLLHMMADDRIAMEEELTVLREDILLAQKKASARAMLTGLLGGALLGGLIGIAAAFYL
ncbi:MAG: hypothetical protein CMI02_00930, partial [Oceanospirillaceae bacterium]|nr:hypothetical protein [Oceanospirillaceae bacterium]